MNTIIENYDIQTVSTDPGTFGWTLMWTTTGGGVVTEHGEKVEQISRALDTALSLEGTEFHIILGDDIPISE